MKTRHLILTCAIALAVAAPASARSTIDIADNSGGGAEPSDVLQCVPYAREVSGIRIYGDAYTWWGKAKGRYKRGNAPRPGAVMAMKPHGNSPLGHVAAVSGVIDSRTILLRHANWSEPGLIENDVQALDVSPNNDWSSVRIWYGPTQSLGSSQWPVEGFIYSDRPRTFDAAKSQNGSARSKNPDFIGELIARSAR